MRNLALITLVAHGHIQTEILLYMTCVTASSEGHVVPVALNRFTITVPLHTSHSHTQEPKPHTVPYLYMCLLSTDSSGLYSYIRCKHN